MELLDLLETLDTLTPWWWRSLELTNGPCEDGPGGPNVTSQGVMVVVELVE